MKIHKILFIGIPLKCHIFSHISETTRSLKVKFQACSKENTGFLLKPKKYTSGWALGDEKVISIRAFKCSLASAQCWCISVQYHYRQTDLHLCILAPWYGIQMLHLTLNLVVVQASPFVKEFLCITLCQSSVCSGISIWFTYRLYLINWTYLRLWRSRRRVSAFTLKVTLSLQGDLEILLQYFSHRV